MSAIMFESRPATYVSVDSLTLIYRCKDDSYAPGNQAARQKTGREFAVRQELGTRQTIKKYDNYIKLYILKVYLKA